MGFLIRVCPKNLSLDIRTYFEYFIRETRLNNSDSFAFSTSNLDIGQLSYES